MMRKYVEIVEEGWFSKEEPQTETPELTPAEYADIEHRIQGDEVWEMINRRIGELKTPGLTEKERWFNIHQIFAGIAEMAYSLKIDELALHRFLDRYLKGM